MMKTFTTEQDWFDFYMDKWSMTDDFIEKQQIEEIMAKEFTWCRKCGDLLKSDEKGPSLCGRCV